MTAKRRAGRGGAPTLPSLAEPSAARRAVKEGPTAVMRAEWVDIADVRPNAAHRPREISGYRTYCALRRMFRQNGSQITDRHIYAADRLRAAVDQAAIGLSGARALLLPVTERSYGPVSGPSVAAQRQAAAAIEVTRAIARFTAAQCELLDAIVLQNRSLQAWCRADGHTPGIEMGRLLAVLDILAEHYAGAIDRDLSQGRVLVA